MRPLLILLATLPLACAPAHRAKYRTTLAQETVPQRAAGEDGTDIPDANDRCRVVREGCADSFEDDGCPDVMIAAAGVCTPDARAKRHIDDAVGELRSDARYGRVAIVGPKEAANCVLEEMVRLGVARTRLHVVDGPGDVTFAVEMWDGRECQQTGEPQYL